MGQKSIETITSMDQRYHDLIGADSLASRLAHWPCDMAMTCYVEDFWMPQHDRVQQIDFDQLHEDYTHIQQANISVNARKFAKKAYPVIHALWHSTADWLLWIDSDVITVADIPAEFWQSQLQDQYLAAYMGVHYDCAKDGRRGDWLVPETGVFGVNLRHVRIGQFREEYRRRYLQRHHQDLRRFYDNDVFGAAIKSVPGPYLDWCQDFVKPYKTPIGRTVLGQYLHHYKAKHSKQSYADAVQ